MNTEIPFEGFNWDTFDYLVKKFQILELFREHERLKENSPIDSAERVHCNENLCLALEKLNTALGISELNPHFIHDWQALSNSIANRDGKDSEIYKALFGDFGHTW